MTGTIEPALKLLRRIGLRERRAANAHREAIARMRRGGKNMRSGETGGAAEHHRRMYGFHADRAAVLRDVANILMTEGRR